MKRSEIENMLAGREMDALIAEKVMGYKWYCVVYEHPPLDAQRMTFLLSDKKAQSNNDGVRPNYPFSGYFDNGDKLVICKPGFHDRNYPSVPAYSTDISAAWEVVEKLTGEGWCLGLINDDNGHWALSSEGMQNLPDEGEDTCTTFIVPAHLWADTAPLAICRAALLAVMEDK